MKTIIKQGRILGSCALLLCMLGYCMQPAKAEGSKELVSDGGYRPYLEWSPNTTSAGIPRKTTLKVYVKENEIVNLGSSVPNSYTAGQDIVFRSPSKVEKYCDVKGTGEGFIDTLAKEKAGPKSSSNSDVGYTPCTFTATETGIYEVEFHAPTTSGDPLSKMANVAFPTDGSQKQGVAAWDITVRDAGGSLKTGRVFTNYLAMNMGSNGLSLNSDFFIQTKDGFLYRTAMNGVDPFGFIFFGNSRGYIDRTDNSTLYHSTKADNNSLNPFLGDVQVQRPDVPDTVTDITHLVFINQPDPDTLIALGIPTNPPIPAKPTNFKFTGGTGGSGNQTFVGVGGYFSFNSSSSGSYEIIIDTNNDNVYDPSQDRVLQNVSIPGSNVVRWDGKDANGMNLPSRTGNAPYNARIRLLAGEYHFPMLDAENNPKGFVIEMTNAPGPFPSGSNKFTVYYNDDNYKTKNGTSIDLGTPGTPTSPRNAATGIDSSSGQHEFSNNYGDFKGIDTWAYFPSEAVLSQLIITNTNQANVRATKSVRFFSDTDTSGTVTVGDRIQYTITYSNLAPGNSDAINFVINDSLPSQLNFIDAAITSQTSGNTITLKTTYNGGGALTNPGTLRVGDSITITITATINNANGGNPISNQASATFNTPDSSATTGTALTDADSGGATTNPPTPGNSFLQNGDNIDAGNDPSKTDDDDPTLITVVRKANMLLVKRITAINGITTTKGGDNLASYINEASNPYDDNTLDLPALKPTDTDKWSDPSTFLIGGINGGNVLPGDELEYTIYFLSAGDVSAANVLMCDRFPNNTNFIPTSFNSGPTQAAGGLPGADRGIFLSHNGSTVSLTNTKDSDAGQYFPPRVDPKTVYPKIDCGGSNINGTMVVNLGNLPNATGSGTPTGSYGFVRFRLRVK